MSVRLNFAVSGMSKVQAFLKEKQEMIPRRIRSLLRNAALGIVRDAKIKAPVRWGRLRNSIRMVETSEGKDYSFAVGTDVEYAKYQEYGTRFVRKKLFLTEPYKRHTKRLRTMIEKLLREVTS